MPPSAQPVPEGFVRVDRGPVCAVAGADLIQPLERLGLLDAGGLSRALRAAGGPAGRGPVAVLSLEGRPERLCLRRVRRGGWLAPWLPKAASSLDRSLSELAATARLRAAGAPVPLPLCVLGELQKTGGFEVAVGTAFEEGAVDALHFLETEPSQDRLLRAADAAGAAVRRFHDSGGRHADLHVKNLLLRERGEQLDVLVIDLDRGRVETSVSPRARLAELMRLYRSLRKRHLLARVGPRGCARFFAAYAGGDRDLRRALRKGLPRERLRLALHSLHYR